MKEDFIDIHDMENNPSIRRQAKRLALVAGMTFHDSMHAIKEAAHALQQRPSEEEMKRDFESIKREAEEAYRLHRSTERNRTVEPMNPKEYGLSLQKNRKRK